MKGVFCMEKSRFTARQVTVCALLSAMVAVLAAVSVTTNAFKITFESFPIYIAGFLFGPEYGLIVGTLGSFIYQILLYGVSATTVLWILPYSILGLVCGLYARRNNFDLSARQYMMVTAACELMVTVLNTGVIYVDSHIYGYYTPALILGALGLRLIICLCKGFIFGAVMPKLISTLRKAALQN